MVSHAVSEATVRESSIEYRMGAYKNKSALRVAKNSTPFTRRVIKLDRTTVAKINFAISMLPHNFSRYLRDGGTKIIDAINWLE